MLLTLRFGIVSASLLSTEEMGHALSAMKSRRIVIPFEVESEGQELSVERLQPPSLIECLACLEDIKISWLFSYLPAVICSMLECISEVLT